MPETRQLNVFISYASPDVDTVRALYQRLAAEKWITPWFDREKLLPGMDWNLEIEKALRQADVILFCLSAQSVSKEGYVQKEIKRALDIADEKPEGVIYDIPLRLEACELPTRLGKKQWLDYYADGAHEKLLKALRMRAEGLQILAENKMPNAKPVSTVSAPLPLSPSDLDLHTFVKINVLGQKPFWIGKYPVTNAQYARFLQSDDFANPQFWLGFPKFNENCVQIGNWGEEGLNWLREKLKDYQYFPPEMWKVEPKYWQNPDFGIAQPNNPVVGVNFYEANAYCNWLSVHWRELPESVSLSSFSLPSSSFVFRLPLKTEWVAAAGGDKPEGRYPWDLPGKATTDVNEIGKRANVSESQIGKTTPVNQYPTGKSPHGVMDMVGNVWEWQANYKDQKQVWLALRGGSWGSDEDLARVSGRYFYTPDHRHYSIGFRVVVFGLPK